MIDIEKLIEDEIINSLNKLKEKLSIEIESELKISIQAPQDKKFGDFTTNIAMQVARFFKISPIDIAKQIKENFNIKAVSKVEIAGKGFINFFVSKDFYAQIITEAVTSDSLFNSNIGKGKNVLVEFVSANPTGPLHIGHGRGAAYGDSLARLLTKTGYNVQKEYYYNDAGNQINNLIKSFYYRICELGNVSYEFPKDGYKGQYIADIAKIILEQNPDILKLSEEEALKICKKVGLDFMEKMINNHLLEFRVNFDSWFNENNLYKDGSLDKALKALSDKGCLYEKDGALWFQSSLFGDEKDRVIKKSDGSYTYFAPDIAYHYNKFNRGEGNDLLIDILGGDHHGYINRLKAAIYALGKDKDALQVKLISMVNLMSNGEKIKMSTREDSFVTLKWLYDEVGVDAARFFFIMRSPDSMLDFDLDLAKEKSSKNPIFYIQYAHARICSIIKKADALNIKYKLGDIDSDLNEQERVVALKLLEYKTVLESAAINMEPHKIAHYLISLAKIFHNFYYSNKIIDEDNLDRVNTKINIIMAVKNTLAEASSILAIGSPEKM